MAKVTIASLRRAYEAGSQTPSQVVTDALSTIRLKDPEIHAFIDVYEDAVQSALELEKRGEEERKAMPLYGVPIAVKNNILIQGKRATASSKILENYVAPYSATVIERLKNAGAIFVGSTNLDEFAMGSSTEHSAFGPTKNPHDTTRVPGGSSGGSAAAVAMEAVPIAIGTDTGGSVRLPGSYCGVVGLKPTYGAVSRFGLIAMGSSLDQAGPLGNCVADVAVAHRVIAGKDQFDATTYEHDTYPTVSVKEKYRIGVPRSFIGEGVDADVRALFEAQLRKLAADGHEIVDISLPLMEHGLAAYYIVMPAEVSSNLARYDGIRFGLSSEGETLLDVYENSRREGFGLEVKRRILLGAYVLSQGYYDAYYRKAETLRESMRRELRDTFQSVDVVVTPTAPTPAFKIGEKADPVSMYLADVFTVPANLTGVPALSVPMGMVERDGASLPVGIQAMAPWAGEERLFSFSSLITGEGYLGQS